MPEPTDADMARARELWLSVLNGGAMSAIAQALADERERARRPFLDLADRHERDAEAADAEALSMARYPEAVTFHRRVAADDRQQAARIRRAAAQEDPK